MAVQRVDARRNRALILAVAEAEVAAHGADASLEQIARTAGVGSATVRRHFPSRRALLQAVFGNRIDALCAHAAALADADDPRAALLDWLSALTTYATSARGMADALLRDDRDDKDDTDHVNACSARLAGAVDPLLHRAARAGAMASGVTTADLISLVTGLALATEHHPDPAAEAHRLLALTVRGISPQS
ncbi:TetR/AcrR family transcriptional regulator [Streptomyces subrutilus]|uniref:TetR family transcriptional regulator n=1 Tax=Streptomyces subrutilus TaxID=36818 RepID=A0A5P2UDE3_9ACTN|nr:TetR family transcriptional regulator [Streptomyces subrutilus]QEU76950.1 TetR family transcriptional regulator [Streptomyces subrutilus]WSJ27839.1 TetR/AcrR family transcriptional regulator [Streptomyces subrutilus]GGZ98717.1 TetR family transcriptional regulator [Streptomyces subrutilus]